MRAVQPPSKGTACLISILDLFRIGIGPSSSHTVGPMRIARRFVKDLARAGLLADVTRVEVALQGSLALTGIGHGSVDAVVLGLLGERPSRIDADRVPAILAGVAGKGRLQLPDGPEIAFHRTRDILLDTHIIPDLHPNGMVLRALAHGGVLLREEVYYSTGGGFFASEKQLSAPAPNDSIAAAHPVRFDYGSEADLLDLCDANGLSICEIVLQNEDSFRDRADTVSGLDAIVAAMLGCIDRGLATDGTLPGGLNVRRPKSMLA
jgi:L-serine dehydratase